MLDYFKNIVISGIPEIERIDEWNELSERLDIAYEYNDFFMPACINDDDEYKRRVRIYRSLGRKTGRDTLHGAFFDIAVNSVDKKIKELCREKCEKSVMTAEELGCRGVIFHTNYIVGFRLDTYKNEWVKRCGEFYRSLAEKYPKMEILIENMFDDSAEMLTRLAEECKDISNFGVCFDVAHATLWTKNLDEWINSLNKYIRHIHINDNDLEHDLHLAMGEGEIDFSFLKKNCFPFAESLLLEVNGIEKFKKSYEFLGRI